MWHQLILVLFLNREMSSSRVKQTPIDRTILEKFHLQKIFPVVSAFYDDFKATKKIPQCVYVNYKASFTQWKLNTIDRLFNYTAQKNINQSQHSQKKEWLSSIIQKRGKSYLVFRGSALPVPSKMTRIDDLKIAVILNVINLFSSGMGLM